MRELGEQNSAPFEMDEPMESLVLTACAEGRAGRRRRELGRRAGPCVATLRSKLRVNHLIGLFVEPWGFDPALRLPKRRCIHLPSTMHVSQLFGPALGCWA